MCGIVGLVSFSGSTLQYEAHMKLALKKLSLRGPDFHSSKQIDQAFLGHTRLSIIDVTSNSNQPFESSDGRYTLTYNGEIFNFLVLKKKLIEKFNISFSTESDTEVLLHHLIRYGEEGIKELNGFFAFTFFDKQENTLIAARDHFGIKPYIYHFDSTKGFFFASELKALLEFPIKREIDKTSLEMYLHLSYIPAPYTILENIKKLMPGEYLKLNINSKTFKKKAYYTLNPSEENVIKKPTYEQAQIEIKEKLEKAVELRMVSDVPLGSFLSGGIDSSIVSTIASKYTSKLNTFSVGFSDEPYFDETSYAELVAKKIGSNHTVFKLSNQEMFENLENILEYIDEPFADSSAIAVYMLCIKVSDKVKVALSGDGADELFSGYNKHMAEFLLRNRSLKEKIGISAYPFTKLLPSSRTSKLGNLTRQIEKFALGSKLTSKERYWVWAGYNNDAKYLKRQQEAYPSRKKEILLQVLEKNKGINDILITDQTLVLPNDMLFKVDSMSMANSIEVRPPFLDCNLVNYVNQLPSEYKLTRGFKKKILQDSFKNILPNELYNRSKKGFEIPLEKWLKTKLNHLIEELLSEKLITEQNLFEYQNIDRLKKQLHSNNPGDSPTKIWALIVFQGWWKKYIA